MDKNIQDAALGSIRSVIGEHRQVFDCLVFDDSQGKVVTCRYVGAVVSPLLRQTEAVRILAALRHGGFSDYRVRLFITDIQHKNVGSIEVDLDEDLSTIVFKPVGNKWVGERGTGAELEHISESISLTRAQMKRLILPIQKLSDVFKQFYGEAKTPHALNMPKLPSEPSVAVDGTYSGWYEREHAKLTGDEFKALYSSTFTPPEDDSEDDDHVE